MTKPSRGIWRCNSAETFGGSAEPSGVCSVARRSAAPRLRGGRPAQGWFEVANAQPGQGALHSVDDARALPDQAVTSLRNQCTSNEVGHFSFRGFSHVFGMSVPHYDNIQFR